MKKTNILKIFFLTLNIIFNAICQNPKELEYTLAKETLETQLKKLFDPKDPITKWDIPKFRTKKAEWDKLMVYIKKFLDDTGSTSFPDILKEEVYSPKPTSSTLTNYIFEGAKNLNNYLEASSIEILKKYNEIELEKRNSRINNFFNKLEEKRKSIIEEVESITVIQKNKKLARDLMLYFLNKIVPDIRESLRLQYINSEMEIRSRVPKKQSEAPAKDVVAQIIDKIRSLQTKLFKTNLAITTPEQYKQQWQDIISDVKKYLNIENNVRVINKVEQFNQKIFNFLKELNNFAKKPDIYSYEAFNLNVENIYKQISIEKLNIDKNYPSMHESSKNLYLNLLKFFSDTLDRIKDTLTILKSTQKQKEEPKIDKNISKDISFPTQTEPLQLSFKDKLRRLKIDVDDTSPQFFRQNAQEVNDLLERINNLENKLELIKQDVTTQKISGLKIIPIQAKLEIYKLYTEIKQKIVSLNKTIEKFQFKPDTPESDLKLILQDRVGTRKLMDWGKLGELLENIIDYFEFRTIINEIKSEEAKKMLEGTRK